MGRGRLGHMIGLAGLMLGAVLSVPGGARAEAPARVVSMNLCTDQLAMLVAGAGQLVSVSALAQDPRGSAMAEEAAAYPANRGLAEEIYLMQPDLVVTGTFSNRATVAMLRRLGIPVAVFDPAYGLDEVRDRLLQMGEVLGRQDAAQALVAEYDARLAALQAEAEGEAEGGARPAAVLYHANGYTNGDRTLAGQILVAAGFENAAIAAGFGAGGFMPLEVLAMLQPDAVITAGAAPGASRAEEIMAHPVVDILRHAHPTGSVTDRDWVCGTPHVLRAVEGLGPLRRAVTGQ